MKGLFTAALFTLYRAIKRKKKLQERPKAKTQFQETETSELERVLELSNWNLK